MSPHPPPALTAQQVIDHLGLAPHPEKGYFAETFRDPATLPNGSGSSGAPRAQSTCIYYLLQGEAGLSHWHRVRDAVEVWHHYAGAPLRLSLARDDGSPVRDAVLGTDLARGERPQVVVQRDEWQHAVSLGDWTLVGCTVAPAFHFESFEMAAPGWEPNGGAPEAAAAAEAGKTV
ncbi:RmlC-like cupin domain-containing protein [Hypoxylon argillaceum]|nr:RmlC-like cupin domain-containing protein [Hypoxylon argillaceum]